MTNTTIIPDEALADLGVLISKAARGNKTAARKARATFNKFNRHLGDGGTLPVSWRTATRPAKPVPVDENGEPVVSEGKPLKAGRLNHKVFWTIVDNADGLADHELEQVLDASHQSVSATRNSLVGKGYLVASGQTRPTKSGGRATVWVLSAWAQARLTAGVETRS